MLRAFPLSIIRSFLLYIRHWYISCRFDDIFQAGSGWNVLILLGSSHQTCKKYTNAQCTVEISWWWAKEIPATCRVFFWQKNLGKFVCLVGFIKKQFVTMHGHMNVQNQGVIGMETPYLHSCCFNMCIPINPALIAWQNILRRNNARCINEFTSLLERRGDNSCSVVEVCSK
jgi:hypothetical protein